MNFKAYQEKSAPEFRNIHQKKIRRTFKDFQENMKQINHHNLIEIAVQEFKLKLLIT